jgi:hypothetical protein
MCASAARPPENGVAVSVVPMSRRAGSPAALRAIFRFASATARPSTSSSLPGGTSAS